MEKVRAVFVGAWDKWKSFPLPLRMAIGVTAGAVTAYGLVFAYRNRRVPILFYRVSFLKDIFDEVPSGSTEITCYPVCGRRLRDSDVIVAVPPKSGTTWTQHILHQIRMHAEPPSFNDQSEVTPWLEVGEMLSCNNIPAGKLEQPAEPRIFKSHLTYQQIEEYGLVGKCRVVYVYRDLKDACLSSWKFIVPMMGIPYQEIPLTIFVRMSLALAEEQLTSLVSFWEHRHDKDIIFLLFEEMKEDPEGIVKKLAEFAEIDLEEDELEQVVEQTSHRVMSNEENWHRFAATTIAKKFSELAGFEYRPELLSGKVRKDGGTTGQGRQELPAFAIAKLNKQWKQIVTPKLGFETYAEMREAWRQENSA